jgi:hypothetical protein
MFKSLVYLLFSSLLAEPSPTHLLVTPGELEKGAREQFALKFNKSPDQIVITELETPPHLSTGDIIKSLRELQGPIHLICYHKAAADCLETLLVYEEDQVRVKRFTSLGGKIYGLEQAEKAKPVWTPITVEQANKNPLSSAWTLLGDMARRLWPRPIDRLYFMHPHSRKMALEQADEKLRKLSENVELLSIDSSVKNYGHLPYSRSQAFVPN